MGDPMTLVESTTPPVITQIHSVIAATATEDAAKPPVTNKNGKKAEGGSGGGSFFTWFMVLALLGVWTSVAVVYFDLVDYQGVLGKLVAYDTDGDGDFDVEDAKVLLDEKPGDDATGVAKKENPLAKDMGHLKLREALKQQLAIIHERVEAKKLAKLALAEVRKILEREDAEKVLGLRREEIAARAKERVTARLQEEEEKMVREEMAKALLEARAEKEKQEQEKKEEEEKGQEEGGKKSKKGEEKGEGKKAEKEDRSKGKEPDKEKTKKGKAEKSDKGGKK